MKVTAFLTDGFETVEALAVIDICRRAGIDTDTVSITGDKNVISAQNIPVKADYFFDEVNLEESDLYFFREDLDINHIWKMKNFLMH